MSQPDLGPEQPRRVQSRCQPIQGQKSHERLLLFQGLSEERVEGPGKRELITPFMRCWRTWGLPEDGQDQVFKYVAIPTAENQGEIYRWGFIHTTPSLAF